MSFSVLSLNARGLRDLVKCKALFLFSRQFGSDFVFFKSLILMIKMLIFGSRSGVERYGFLMVQSTLQAFPV